jgi:hypothetical protein
MNAPAIESATIRASARRRRARRGVAALEAVIVLPLMFFIIVGGVEMYLYTRVIAVMDRVAFTLANSISIQTSLIDGASPCTTPAQMSPDHICTYGTITPTLLMPMDPANAAIIVSVYATNTPSNGNPPSAWTNISSPNHGWRKIIYQGAKAATPTSRITAASLPTSIISRNLQTADTVIAVEVFYKYQPFAFSGAFFRLFFNPQQYSRALIRPRYADLCRLIDPVNPPPANSICGS